MVTLDFIYERAGWEPFDTFAQRMAEQNQFLATTFMVDDIYRGIGATSWMLAHVIMALSGGHTCQIVGQNTIQTEQLVRNTANLLDAIFHQHMSAKVSSGGLGIPAWNARLYGSVRTHGVATTTRIFVDHDWKNRAIRRIQGPFAMTREIRLIGGVFKAYAEDDEFLMDITPEGVRDILDQQSTATTLLGTERDPLICIGFDSESLQPLEAFTLTLRGPTALSSVVTKTKGWLHVDKPRRPRYAR